MSGYFGMNDGLMDDLTFYHAQAKKETAMNDLQLKEPNITVNGFLNYIRDNRVQMVPTTATPAELEFLAVSHALGGEVGELQNIVKKIIKHRMFYLDCDLHDKFVLEAGDALHYLLSLIDLAGFKAEYIMACNVVKLDERRKTHEAQATVLPSATAEP